MINRVVRVAGQVLLTTTAVIGVCCVLLTVAGALFGVRPLIFRSGSMSPAITAGSLAIAYPVQADRLKIGDIVSVPVAHTRVAHRITKIAEHNGGATLQLKGDANQTPDARSYQVAKADKVMIAVPELGRAIAWLSRSPGVFVLAAYAALMLALVLRRPASGSSDHDHQRPVKPRRALPITRRSGPKVLRSRTIAAATVLGMAPLVQMPSGWAAWNDGGTVKGISISTTTVAAPVLSCNALGTAVTLTWTAVTNATSYTVFAGSNPAVDTTATTFKPTSSLVNLSSQAYVVANRDFGAPYRWTSVPSNKVNYTVAAAAAVCG